MKKPEIRRATSQDIPALQALLQLEEDYHKNLYPEYFRESSLSVPAEELEKEIAQTNCSYLVALEKQEIIGFIHAKKRVFSEEPQFKKIEYILIEDCAVREEYRKQGVAKALLQAVRDWAAEHEINRIQLQVWGKNDPAIQVYKNIGFQDLLVRMELIEKHRNLE